MATRRKKLAVRWSPSAERDLGRAIQFMRERSPRLARSLVQRILRVVDLIRAQPEIGEVAEDITPVGAIRHFPSPPFRVIYRVTEGEIWIARVWDTRRSPLDLHLPADPGPPAPVDGATPSDSDETPS